MGWLRKREDRDSTGATEVWIGLAEIRPPEDNVFQLDTERDTYTNVVGLAIDERSFRELVRERCERWRLLLLSVENMEPLETRTARAVVSEELLEYAAGLSPDYPFSVSTFHTFPRDSEE